MQAHRRSSVSRILWTSAAGGCASACVVVALAAALIAGMASPAGAQQVLAVVNGIPITSYDVDQRIKLAQLSGSKATGRKEVLDDLINDRVKLHEAKRFGIEIPNSDVESSFATMASRMGMKPDQLGQSLSGRGVNADTLKMRIRADLAWGHLVRGRFQASMHVGEGDIHAILGQPSDNDTSSVGHVYRLRPILFIVPQGSPPAAFEARRREADALRNRFNSCEEGVRFARELRDVAVRDQIVRSSANLPAQMRTMLNSLEIGKLTVPETTAQGVEVFALCGKEVTRAETPRKQETKQELFAKRYEAQSKRYLEQVRRSAMIEYK
jgi:peptidyl-prolyl cis-trans isomerase SurA